MDERDRAQPGGDDDGVGVDSHVGGDEAASVFVVVAAEAVEAKGVALVDGGVDGGEAALGDEDAVR